MITCSDSLVEIDQTNKEQSLQTKELLIKKEHPKFKGFKDRSYYLDLEDLTRVLAEKQHEYRPLLIKAMKKSRVREGILNISKEDQLDKGNTFIRELTDKIEVEFEKNGKQKTKKINVRRLLKNLSADINLYFPVVSQRKKVILDAEPFWVAFNPPDRDSSEYFIKAFNEFGESKILSSKVLPEENILVLAYSENQENYSMAMIGQVPIDCTDGFVFGEDCLPTTPDPIPDPVPVPTAEGISFTRFKTLNIDDGWLDGDIEIDINLSQSLARFTIDLNSTVGIDVGVGSFSLIRRYIEHDAGHYYWYWYETRYRNSNKWNYVNARRRLIERQSFFDFGGVFGVPQVTVFNDIFELHIREDDGLVGGSTLYIKEHYNFNSYLYGIERQIQADGGTFYFVIDKGFYPLTSF